MGVCLGPSFLRETGSLPHLSFEPFPTLYVHKVEIFKMIKRTEFLLHPYEKGIPMIRIERLSKKYGFLSPAWALREMTLTISPGVFTLLGLNGAGKSTLLKILASLLRPSGGLVEMNGVDLSQSEKIREMIGYLPQHFQFYPKLTVREMLHHTAILKGMKGTNRIKKEVDLRLEQMALTSIGGKRVGTLSGGMHQRLGIAQAILGDPEILLLDEPFSGLDAEEKERIRELIRRMGNKRTVILSTHHLSDIERLCDRAAVLHHGRLKFSGELSRLRQFADGRVWEANLDEEEIQDPHKILLITQKLERGYRVKIIADSRPALSAKPLPPIVEDGLLALIGGVEDA